ncbi:transmembrane protein 255B [Strigops habroptila]|uniref:transmembrane protein 255B n=1 Tax=Strigops habroptila TaxID=2489341 RepID=UPI0011CF89F3|nr:transmembrane protein 255B [Strigops habroptila]
MPQERNKRDHKGIVEALRPSAGRVLFRSAWRCGREVKATGPQHKQNEQLAPRQEATAAAGSITRPAPAPAALPRGADPPAACTTRPAPAVARRAAKRRQPWRMMAPPPPAAGPGPLAALDPTADERTRDFAESSRTWSSAVLSFLFPTPNPSPLPTGQFAKRKKTSLWFTVSLLVVSVFILTIGLAATTRTENVTVGGYYPGIVLGFGSFLGIVGIYLVENRRQILVASIVFISFGVVAAFCCAIVDGVFAARHIEPRPLYNKRCQFYSSGIGFLYDAYQTEVTCYTLNSRCQLKVKSNTCYCCDLYNCENSEQSSSYYEFLGVSSCQDVVHLYRLLWSSTVLNIIGLFLGIITAAILGAFKDMVPLSQIAFSAAAPPPQILYNPAQQILTYAGFCPSAATISTYPSYPLPLQPAGNFPGTSSTDISLSEETQPPSQSSSSYGLPPNAPALYTPTYLLPGEKPPPYAP